MRSLVTAVLLVGCSQSHVEEPSCELMGGWCQTPDLPCGEEARFAGPSLCEQEYDACCVPEVVPTCSEMGGSCIAPDEPCVGTTYEGASICELADEPCCVPRDPAVELCRELCHPDRCGFPFEAPVRPDECLEHCENAIPGCDGEAIATLEMCLGRCDSFVPCVYDVGCVQP